MASIAVKNEGGVGDLLDRLVGGDGGDHHVVDPVGIQDRLADRLQLGLELVPIHGQEAGDSGKLAAGSLLGHRGATFEAF